MFTENIFAQLSAWQNSGLKTGLATLIRIDGSSPRPRGAQIAVAENGSFAGVISSGCAEEAIIAEAQKALADGSAHVSRYGKDSPYLDIELPCGSGLDILFTGTQLEAVTAHVSELHSKRQTAHITLQPNLSLAVSEKSNDTSMAYTPDYHLHVFGSGPHFTSFAQLAHMLGYRIFAHSTDSAALSMLADLDITSSPMTHQTRFDPNAFDAHSGVITLFHEHNLEMPILQAALNSDAHFIGALGSRKTHAQRVDLLAMQPPCKRPVSDIFGPIGLDIGASNPPEIALSILAQITEQRRKATP